MKTSDSGLILTMSLALSFGFMSSNLRQNRLKELNSGTVCFCSLTGATWTDYFRFTHVPFLYVPKLEAASSHV